MSAFMVEDKTINKIVAGLANMERDFQPSKDLGFDLHTKEGKGAFGTALFALNLLGVEARYGEGQAKEFRPLNYVPRLEIPPDDVQLFKSLQCLLYQCAEGEVVENPLYIALEKVLDRLARHIVYNSNAYDKADWS